MDVRTYYMNQARATRRLFRVMFPKLMLARKRRRSEIEIDLLPIVADRQRDAVDVGAYAGVYTMRLAKLARTVYAFEPDVEMAAMLQRAVPANVRVSSNAVSDRQGTAEFHVPLSKGRRAVTCGSLVVPQGCDYEVRTVKTTTLDAALANADVGYIKIDVEGTEQWVLLGAQQLIARCRPVILAEANKPEALATVAAFLERLGYVGFFVYGGKTLGLDEYKVEMHGKWQGGPVAVARKQGRFVYNFFFAPSEAEKGLRTEMEGFLARPGPSNAR